MAPAEYRTLLRTLNLSQERAAVWLGVSKRTGQNYAKKGPPEPVARLLRAWIRLGHGAADLAATEPIFVIGGIDRSPSPLWKNP